MNLDFDPLKFIDRDFEQSLFEELLQFNDSARLLAIGDKTGMGKSELLRKFQHRCRINKPRLPVALIQPTELFDSSPWAWVKAVVEQLSNRFQLPFPRFEALELARINHDFTAIGGIRGQVDARGANFSQAQQVRQAGVLVENAQHVTVQPATLTEEQSRNIQKAIVQAFLADLQALCQQQPVVLLLDHYEKTLRQQPALHQWLLETFLDQCCFDLDHRPPNLIIVLAGQELPAFHSHWHADDCYQVIKSVQALGRWEKGHVEKCLQVYGYTTYQPHEVETFFHWLQTGTTPGDIVNFIKTRLQQQGKAI